MTRFAAVLIAAILPGSALGMVKTQNVEYEVDGRKHIGYLAYDDATTAPARRPGVLVVPEWWGMNEYVQSRARQLAELGYVAFVADMYGGGKVTTDAKEAGSLAGALKGNRPELRKRALAALEELRRRPQVDRERVGAIGYCFGGTTVLELARSGADVKGVVSFHGGLDFPEAPTTGSVTARSLVLHGADDPMVPEEQVAKFMNEMLAAGASVQLVAYPGAVHSFTNPAAGSDKSKGVAYNKDADEKSWAAMKEFLSEMLNAGD